MITQLTIQHIYMGEKNITNIVQIIDQLVQICNFRRRCLNKPSTGLTMHIFHQNFEGHKVLTHLNL